MSSYSTPVQWTWITLSGPDAADYLHRMTTVNVQAMTPGMGSPGCLLNPQGRIRSYFTLWRTSAEEFAFELDAGRDGSWAKELATAIDQFHFAEQFVLRETHKELECFWAFPNSSGTDLGSASALSSNSASASALSSNSASASALSSNSASASALSSNSDSTSASVSRSAPEMTHRLDSSGCHVCQHGSRDFGRPWISVWGNENQLKEWRIRHLPNSSAAEPQELESWRIHALKPKTDQELTSDSNPLEIGLVDSIAPNKGCYPGQEVIEKIISLGSPPRRLARLVGSGAAPEVGSAVTNLADPPLEIGKLTSVIPLSAGFEALAILKKIHAKEGLEILVANGSKGRIAGIAPYA